MSAVETLKSCVKTPKSKAIPAENPTCSRVMDGNVYPDATALFGTSPEGRTLRLALAIPARKSIPLRGSKLPPPKALPKDVTEVATFSP
jgi:hypothetical protein